MKSQRKAGFIKNYSSKQLPIFLEEPSQFSYFRHCPDNYENDEFSPYKSEENQSLKKKIQKRPPLPTNVKKHKNPIQFKTQGEKIYTQLKQRMNSYEQRKQRSKQKLSINIDSVRNKIAQIENAIKDLKVSRSSEKPSTLSKKQRFIDQSGSSSSSSQSEEIAVKVIPSPKLSLQKYKENKINEEQFNESRKSNSRKESKEEKNEQQTIYQRENIITFNSRVANQPPLKIVSYSSSSSEQKPLKNQQQEQSQQSYQLAQNKQYYQSKKKENDIPSQRNTQDVYQNRGGICFDIDTRQFTQPVTLPREERVPKKSNKVDKRTQILKRRETAKAYDRMARKAIFTTYH